MIFVAIGFFLLVLAAILYFARSRSAAKQAASVNWPTAEGVVSESYIHSYRDKDDDLHFMARVQFTYQIAGQEFSSKRLAWGGEPASRVSTQAEATVARYPVGSRVLVHYNPEKPQEAVLNPADTSGIKTMTITWIACAVVGAGMILVGFLTRD